MDINTIVKITSRAWSLEILATIHSGVPGRQATLLSSIGANRTAFTKSLIHLVNLGYIWLHLVTFGSIWLNLVEFGSIWLNFVQFG